MPKAFLGPTDLLHKWEDFCPNYDKKDQRRDFKFFVAYMYMENESLSQTFHPYSILNM